MVIDPKTGERVVVPETPEARQERLKRERLERERKERERIAEERARAEKKKVPFVTKEESLEGIKIVFDVYLPGETYDAQRYDFSKASWNSASPDPEGYKKLGKNTVLEVERTDPATGKKSSVFVLQTDPGFYFLGYGNEKRDARGKTGISGSEVLTVLQEQHDAKVVRAYASNAGR
jgi:hypothetical protein